MKRKTDFSIKCNFCNNNAVINYQKVWVRFKVCNNGNHIENKKFSGVDFEQPIENDNIHLCKKHNKDWLETKI